MEAMLEVSRRETKFELNLMEIERVKQKLDAILEKDANSHMDEGYLVRSLYFDTIADNDYQEKADGLLLRKKVRLRIYHPDEDTAKLELKQKIGQNQVKRSLLISREQAKILQSGEYGFLAEIDNPFAQFMHALMTTKLYYPKCIVEYKRIAYSAPLNKTRVTIDSGLCASLANLDVFDNELMAFPIQSPFLNTLEVKYDNFFPSYVKDVLECHEKPQVSLGKYYMARSFLFGGDN